MRERTHTPSKTYTCIDCRLVAPVAYSNRRLRCDDCRRAEYARRARERSGGGTAFTCIDCGIVALTARPKGRQRCTSCAIEDDRGRARVRSLARWNAEVAARQPLSCGRCGIVIERDGARRYCEECALVVKREKALVAREKNRERDRAHKAAWKKRNPDRMAAYKARRRAREYGVDYEDFDPVEVFERDDWTCSLCRTAVDAGLVYPHPLSASLDHRLPLARGGPHSRANTALAHLTCNVRKNVRTPEEYEMAVEISKDKPRTLRHVDNPEDEVQVTTRGEHLQLTTTRGYRDVTDDDGKKGSRKSSSSTASSAPSTSPSSS